MSGSPGEHPSGIDQGIEDGRQKGHPDEHEEGQIKVVRVLVRLLQHEAGQPEQRRVEGRWD